MVGSAILCKAPARDEGRDKLLELGAIVCFEASVGFFIGSGIIEESCLSRPELPISGPTAGTAGLGGGTVKVLELGLALTYFFGWVGLF